MTTQTLPNYLTTVLVLLVGFCMLAAILLRNAMPLLGSVLAKKSLKIQLPFSEIIDLELEKGAKPRRVILRFKQSVGLYNGTITVNSGATEIAKYHVPKLPEYYDGDILGLFGKAFNRNIFRQGNVLIVKTLNCQPSGALSVVLHINENVQNQEMRSAYNLTGEDELAIYVRGRRAG